MHFRDVGGQSAIHIDRHARHFTLRHPLAHIVDHNLGPTQAKGGNKYLAAAGDGGLDDVLEFVGKLLDALMGAPAVGASRR